MDELPPLDADYVVESPLGRGGVGVVLRARERGTGRRVALKCTQPRDETARARFLREGRVAAQLRHPGIVNVHRVGTWGGQLCLVYELVPGARPLDEAFAELELPGRLDLLAQTAEALASAHAAGLVHRDIKGDNVLVDQEGRARVADFGLATGADLERLTRTGAAVGTPAYMAPEQVRGQLDKIDGRTDIYALGATFYEMLTAQPPFEAPTFLELAKKICDEDPISPRKRSRDVPVDVETICLKALEKRKEDRYQNAAEMAEDLAAFLSDEEIVAQRPSLPTRFGRWARRRPALLAGMIGFLAVVLGATGFYLSLPGAIRVQSDPPGAEVLIDGEVRGTTAEDAPLRIELEAGSHEIRFRKEGYLELVPGLDTITVQHNVDLPIPRAKLVLRKGLVQVEGSEEVAGARLRIYTPGRAQLVREAGLPFEGALDEGSYEVELSKHARDVGLRDVVKFYGPQDQIDRWHAMADFFVLPTRFDAFGNVVLEAMATGVPTLVSAKAGAAEVVEEGKTGWGLGDPDDVQLIANKIIELAGDREQQKTMGEAGRAAAERDLLGRRSCVGREER